jgi:drug/metabolite transporter (DMT)-like permease
MSTKAGRHDFWLLVLSGLFFAGDMVFWNLAVMHTSVTNATVLANTTPVFVVLAGWLFFKERVGRIFIVGMAVAVGGSAIMMSRSVSMTSGTVWGDISAVGGAIFYAGYVLTLARARQRASIVATGAIGGAAAAITLMILAMIFEDNIVPQSMHGWMVIIGVAILVQLGGQMLIATSLSHLPAGLVATMFLSQPLIPGFVAWLLFDEGVTGPQVIGAVALLAGLEISRRGTQKKKT